MAKIYTIGASPITDGAAPGIYFAAALTFESPGEYHVQVKPINH